MLTLLFALLLGVLLGYGVFYFRYMDAKVIDEMRENLIHTKNELASLQMEHREINDQNKILKHKGQFLLDQNDDYTKIISELSRIIHLIKKASSQVKDLNATLAGFDPSVEEKYLRLGARIAEDEPVKINVPVYEKKQF
jgi:predicted nuclease with TOPRIM domain